jgi:hypothetical protein
VVAPSKQVPTKAPEAKAFIKTAFAADRYEFDRGNHFAKRLAERKLTVDDLKNAIAKLIRITEYPGSQPWTTCWRVVGPDLDGNRIGVGVKLYLDDDLEWALCITIIDKVE